MRRRDFDTKLIRRIQQRMDENASLSRRQLSREICEWMGWQSRNGKWQEMGCRKTLAELNRRGVLRLPQRERICERTQTTGSTRLEIEIPELSCPLQELGEVTVMPVGSRHSQASKVAR